MGVPRAKKPKQGLYTLKEVRQKCRETGNQVQLMMIAAIQYELKASNEEMMRVLQLAARYSQYYDDHLVVLKDAAEQIYNASNGEIDLRTIEMKMRYRNA